MQHLVEWLLPATASPTWPSRLASAAPSAERLQQTGKLLELQLLLLLLLLLALLLLIRSSEFLPFNHASRSNPPPLVFLWKCVLHKAHDMDRLAWSQSSQGRPFFHESWKARVLFLFAAGSIVQITSRLKICNCVKSYSQSYAFDYLPHRL